MAEPTLLKTPLFDWHQSHGDRLVDFVLWLFRTSLKDVLQDRVSRSFRPLNKR